MQQKSYERPSAARGAYSLRMMTVALCGFTAAGCSDSTKPSDPIDEAPLLPEVTWHGGPALPTPMSLFAATAFQGAIYVAGGFDSVGIRSEVLRLDGGVAQWVRVADLPAPRFLFALVALGDSLYAIGGAAGHFIARSVYVYSAQSDEWIEGAEMSRRRNDHGAAAVRGHIVVVGGRTFDDSDEIITRDSVGIYDPATGQWRSGAPIPRPRLKPKVEVVDGLVYVFGGTTPGEAAELVAIVDVYDISTDSWREATVLPTMQERFGSVTVGQQVHLLGCFNRFSNTATIEMIARHDVYDPTTNTWTRLMPGMTPRFELTLVLLGREVYAIGGVTRVQPPFTRTDVVEIFTPQ